MSERIEKLLAALLLFQMKNTSMKDKITQLNLAGFTNVEIADMLDTSTGSVAQVIYESKRKVSRPKKKAAR